MGNIYLKTLKCKLVYYEKSTLDIALLALPR